MKTTSPLSQEVWERTPAEAQAYIRALEARVAALEATVQRLLERLRMDSQNSSQPPSSDAPAPRRPRQRRTPSGRKPGGQPGHHGQTRALVPLEDVEAVLPVKPTHCARCQHPLHGEDGQPQRHQVTELPPVQPVVTEYQLHSLVCPACGATTRAALPVGVPPGGFGPRVQAVVALCTGAYRLSKRTTQEVMADLFGIAMGLGTISHLEQATVQAVAAPVAEAQAYVRTQPVASPGRDRVARRANTRLVVGRGDHVGHGLRGAPVAWGQGRTGAVGRTVLRHPGDGPLERLHLVSHPVAASLLGASAAGL